MDLFIFDDLAVEKQQPNEYATYFKVSTQEPIEVITKRITYHLGHENVPVILNKIADHLANK